MTTKDYNLGSLEEDFKAIGLNPSSTRAQSGSAVNEGAPQGLSLLEQKLAQQFGGAANRSRTLGRINESRQPQTRAPQTQNRAPARGGRGPSRSQLQAVSESLDAFNARIRAPLRRAPGLAQNEGIDRVRAMLEDVRSVVSELSTVRSRDAVTGFANIAVISEMLARRTNKIATRLGSRKLAEGARVMSSLANVTGKIAKRLNEKVATMPNFKSVKLNERFSQAMGVLTAGIDLYSSLTEGPDAIAPLKPAAPGAAPLGAPMPGAPAPGMDPLAMPPEEGMDPLADPSMGMGTPPAPGVEGMGAMPGAPDPNDPLGLGLGAPAPAPAGQPPKPGSMESMADGERVPMGHGGEDPDLDGDLMDGNDPLSMGGDDDENDPLGL